jgi:hypothetical protein
MATGLQRRAADLLWPRDRFTFNFHCNRLSVEVNISPGLGKFMTIAQSPSRRADGLSAGGVSVARSSIYVVIFALLAAYFLVWRAGLALMLARDRAGKSVTPALLVMVVGGFWKHNMIGIPLTAVAWLFLNHGKRAIRPVGISAIATGVGLLICRAAFGKEFFDNLLVARDYGLGHVLRNIGHLSCSGSETRSSEMPSST